MSDHQPAPESCSLFEPGRNCWRVNTAKKFELVVDGAAYFRALREALIAAEWQVLLIGWDFDLEIEMLPGESDADGDAPDGLPNKVADFIKLLVNRSPELNIYILRWSGSAVIAPGRLVPAVRLSMSGPDRIKLALDGRHPVGACHHQKIVIVDDRLAFCGGIDVTDARWDTPDHTPEDPRRVLRDGSPADPWHDATTAVTGPVARDLADLARMRWKRATGEALNAPDLPDHDIWPASLDISCRNIPVAISRTVPPDEDHPLVNEIEEMILVEIASAKSSIYIESQYFASDAVTEALSRRLREPTGPDIVVINPVNAENIIEDSAMNVTRTRMVKALQRVDHDNRFCILTPVNAASQSIYVHAKVCVIDDRVLRVGSSNIDRRSMGFDTECDLSIEARDDDVSQIIADLRNRLLAEHLGCSQKTLADRIAKTGSILAAIHELNASEGRRLQPLDLNTDTGVGAVLADTRLLDPRFKRGTPKRRVMTSRHIAVGVAIVAIVGTVYRYLIG
ncbi:phospholipase D-like domain-containing protein [Aliiroseovarius sp. F47248L]|uniref:phospholipase D-like domain-containing protein n=1 Tax=Aliiroseovarius sp. F47248L TaxID=2926420 RepID=UPI001FF1B202|nr:phospholipase D-like domain-containing protein [Aliiroseovarius sp. F47248L]MCK0139266.1 phospholipase D-like domain-containing protein [Aliiroseovarius sp. F47248L]